MLRTSEEGNINPLILPEIEHRGRYTELIRDTYIITITDVSKIIAQSRKNWVGHRSGQMCKGTAKLTQLGAMSRQPPAKFSNILPYLPLLPNLHLTFWAPFFFFSCY